MRGQNNPPNRALQNFPVDKVPLDKLPEHFPLLPDIGDEFNVFMISADQLLYSGSPGETDIFIFDLATASSSSFSASIQNFDPDQDFIVFANFDVDDDGAADLFAAQEEPYPFESMFDNGPVSGVKFTMDNYIGFLYYFDNDAVFGRVDIRVYGGDINEGQLLNLSNGSIGFASGPVSDQNDPVLIYAGDYVL